MVIYYFLGIVSLMFSILSIYPLFQDTNIWLGIVFTIFTLLFFYVFCSTDPSSGKKNIGQRIIITISTLILTLVFEFIGLWVYIEIFTNWREITILAPVFKLLYALFNIPTGWDKGNLYLKGVASYVYTFTPNAGNFGLVYLLMIIFGLFSLLILLGNNKRTRKFLLIGGFSLFAYLFFRCIALTSFFCLQEVNEYNGAWNYLIFFWHPIYSFLSLLPWILLLGIMFGSERVELFDYKTVFNKNSFAGSFFAALSFGIAVFLIILLLFWLPSGKAKPGRILFEEYYSDWSKSIKPIDEGWYNQASTYNYYTFRKYLNSVYQVTVNQKPLSYVDLSEYDVLILKIPTKPYPESVIRKIVAYVRNGGGLWIIGDHTNVFGSSTYLNPLIKHFGVKFRYDAAYHNITGSFNYINNITLIKHPIMQNVPVFLFATPCTLEVNNPFMRTVIPGETTKTYPMDYSTRNFFPDTRPDLNTNFGTSILMAAGNYGRGRVAIFTDSTVFSNFHIYLPGKTELALATVNWLNHRPLLLLKFMILILAGIFFIKFRQYYKQIQTTQRNMIWPVITGIVFIGISILAINFYNLIAYPLPREQRPIVKVGFLDKYSSIYLPYAIMDYETRNNYNTFYTWGQREGLCCRYYFEIDKAVNESKAIFMVLPKRKFEQGDLTKLNSFLQKGGKVFLFDCGGKDSTSNSFLKRYGLSLVYQKRGNGKILTPENRLVFTNSLSVGTIKGTCLPILNWEPIKRGVTKGNRYPILIKKGIGMGELYVFGGILNFSNYEFGLDGIVPKGKKKQINQLILEIYKLAGK